MQHALLGIQAHRDLAKFDFEDGLLRSIVAQRMIEPSTISRIVVDLAIEDQALGGQRALPRENDTISALVWLTAGVEDDLVPTSMSDLFDEVAASVVGWSIRSTELRDLERDWVGTATPGRKLTYLLRRTAEVSDDQLESWLEATAETCASRMPSGGLSYHILDDPIMASPALDASMAFWFPTADRLTEADSFGVFDPIDDANIVQGGATRRLLTTEHRLFPNPNFWPIDLESEDVES